LAECLRLPHGLDRSEPYACINEYSSFGVNWTRFSLTSNYRAYNQKNQSRILTTHIIAQNKCKIRRMNAFGQAEWSREEENKLVWRINKRLIPLHLITYGLQYYDKVMLSQAACIVRTQARYTTDDTRLFSDCEKISTWQSETVIRCPLPSSIWDFLLEVCQRLSWYNVGLST
jgi:hypothetical protein